YCSQIFIHKGLWRVTPCLGVAIAVRECGLVSFSNRTHVRGTRKKRLLIGTTKKGSWLESTTSLSIECTARAGALSSLLGALFAAFGLFFHHGELDFALHVVNAVNDNANFVADGVCLLGSRADDLACILVVRVIIVGQGVKRH